MKFPIALEWTISEKKLKALKENEGLSSKEFSVAGLSSYFLLIYPNGNNEENRGQTWIYLHFQNVVKIKAECVVSIPSANSSRNFNFVYTKDEGRGCWSCLSNKLFDPQKKFIVDGKMVIKVKGFVESEINPVPISKDTLKSDDLGDSLWNDGNEDFTIIVKNQNIKAHKTVLANRSSVFATMFKTEFKEGQENKVELTDFSFKVVEFGSKRCYYKCDFNTMNIEDNMLLLQFFEKYNMEKFKAELENYLVQNITVSNVCSFVKCSQLSNSPKLEKVCIDFLLKWMKNSTPVLDIDSLDNDFALRLLEMSFYNRCST
uniref:BTB domain-containing protein n=1 Tax=Panagrolaimus sp. ES5 TaxID=591445 RepID=A0AC34F457_9BILA